MLSVTATTYTNREEKEEEEEEETNKEGHEKGLGRVLPTKNA